MELWRRLFGVATIAVGTAGWLVWFLWRLMTLPSNVAAVAALVIELSGLIAGILVSVGLVAVGRPCGRLVESRESHRYAFVIADHVGRTRNSDLHADIRTIAGRFGARRLRTAADRAMLGVLSDGPRRFATVVTLGAALLLGMPLMPLPPAWAVSSAALSAASLVGGHMIMTTGHLRLGDRTRWSFAALGEILAPADRDGVAPRRWVGTVAAVVVLSIAIGLRGISDRWTHGLPAMTGDDRLVTLAISAAVVLGALFTLGTITGPLASEPVSTSRRLEERTARRSALGAAVCVGLVGLVAGILPTGVDPASDDGRGVETFTEQERSGRG